MEIGKHSLSDLRSLHTQWFHTTSLRQLLLLWLTGLLRVLTLTGAVRVK